MRVYQQQFPSFYSDEAIADQLFYQMTQQKSFLRQRYSIRNLSDETGIHLYKLSAFINQKMGCGFNDYLNKFRITHCIGLIQDGRADFLTLQALAGECGFTNRNTFIAAFKKHLGYPPSSFVKNARAASTAAIPTC